MNHSEVVERVHKWLLRIYPQEKYVLETVVGSYGPDWQVRQISPERVPKVILQVECKGTYGDPDRAIGQCLGYLTVFGAPILLAIPEDYAQLSHAQRVIRSQKLPIDLQTVSYSGVSKNACI